MKFGSLVAVSVAAFALITVGCDNKKNETSSGPGAATTGTSGTSGAKVDMAAARTVFNERCSACHGTSGKGDGPGAAALNPKPRDYTNKDWQKSVTDEQIAKTIKLGGAAVGKSPIMPASPDLDEKPEVVDGLVQIIREFGK